MDPHGGPADPMWQPMQDYLAGLIAALPERPRAILLVSGHWEEAQPTVHSGAHPGLLYDYYGFPEHTYRLRWDAPGAPDLARRAKTLIEAAGFAAGEETQRGWDHGVFVPMKVAVPGADIPLAQLSLRADLDPAAHIAIGRALAPLRDEGVLIVGSGFFTHNLAALRHTGNGVPSWSSEFDDWGRRALETRDWDALLDFLDKAPAGRYAHPRTEHFAPLFVTMGAAEAGGELDAQKSVIDGFWMGMAKRSVQFD